VGITDSITVEITLNRTDRTGLRDIYDRAYDFQDLLFAQDRIALSPTQVIVVRTPVSFFMDSEVIPQRAWFRN
jgi:hypothetical protein